MGYNIGIGELEVTYNDEYISIDARAETHPDAPDLGNGDASGKGNYRYPGYSSFANWCDELNIRSVFYEEGGTDYYSGKVRWNMKGGHPGATPLTQSIYDTIKSTLDKYRLDHPNSVLPTAENTKDLKPFDDDPEHDYTLARLVWFEFWMKWALENCKQPVISNS